MGGRRAVEGRKRSSSTQSGAQSLVQHLLLSWFKDLTASTIMHVLLTATGMLLLRPTPPVVCHPSAVAVSGSPAAAAGAVVGLDIGCGANLIYCLLGAAIYGWRMVGVDVTDIAITAAQQLVVNNPQLQGLLEVRRSACIAGADLTASKAHHQQQQHDQQNQQQQQQGVVLGPLMGAVAAAAAAGGASGSQQQQQQQQECFHFCMCNPPFFESLAEANQNPNTACGGE